MPTTRGQARAANGGAPAVKPKPAPKKAVPKRKASPKDTTKEKEDSPKVSDEKRKADEVESIEENEDDLDDEKQTKLAKTKENQDVKEAEKEKTNDSEEKDEASDEEQNKETQIDANKRKVEEEEKNDVQMVDGDKESQSEDNKSKTNETTVTSVRDGEVVKQEEKSEKKEEDTPMADAPQEESKINPETEQPETLNGTPNPVIEKGTFYWFFRNKVDVDEAESLDDVQRAYMVMRPIPHGQKPGNDDVKNEDINRVLIFPKKKFPSVGHHEREICFLEKPNSSVTTIRDTVLASRSYETKTKGTRTLAAAQAVASGVYSILKGSDDRSTHFAYILTSPTDLTSVTTEFGLHERGSFVISVRNPEFKPTAPQGVPVGKNVDMPTDLKEKFNGKRWTAVDREFLDVEGVQILWVGESGNVHVAGEEGKQEEAAKKDLEGLEEEDKERVEGLKADDPVFDDLDLDAKNFEGLKVSWD
ncbi:hypothetical protein BJ508DRAFT_244519 [Ascobolus immersus RN42]|uniref:Uncharacterized protein n=1 Tax=Ascobolus immersus RN42 TaxID=1160509 RepID=A0A3N4HMG5_ASCIM|nr:hypothetical protein BJ508DRAFT_244519 [Ascobolus immersus RN42]